MAKIEEHLIVIKLSKLVKENSKSKNSIADQLTAETMTNLEQLVQELLGDNLVEK